MPGKPLGISIPPRLDSDAGSELGDEIMHSVADEYGWPDYRSTVRIADRVDLKILA
jgi:hypothetical protein